MPAENWSPGDRVRVVDGPLAGASGEIVKGNDKGRYIVWVDLLGIGSALDIHEDLLAEPIGAE